MEVLPCGNGNMLPFRGRRSRPAAVRLALCCRRRDDQRLVLSGGIEPVARQRLAMAQGGSVLADLLSSADCRINVATKLNFVRSICC